MKIFRKKNNESKNENIDEVNSDDPIVSEIILEKDFSFMYKNFVISSQHDLYLLLEEKEGILDVLCFKSFSIYKYGYPNDEVGHPLQKYGLGFYGFFEVENSNIFAELEKWNSFHPKHIKGMYLSRKHYVAKFKDVTLEIVCDSYELKQMNISELNSIISKQIEYLK